jgi:serine/threonine protein kinase
MADITSALTALHDGGYVHGDLSPNNLLYDQTDRKGKFTIVDWSMLCPAEQFLKKTKGHTRVGCWSPEHFSLTTSRLKTVETDHRWLIYSQEMQNYIKRLLDFSFSTESKSGRESIREYFTPYISQPDSLPFQGMYEELKTLAAIDPSSIGMYHDIRYLMDTIAKIVSCGFPDRTEAQQNRYDAFLALSLVQNLPDRTIYLQSPNRLIRRLSLVLRACENVERETASLQIDGVEAETILMGLLR